MGLVVRGQSKQHWKRLLCHAGRAAGLETGTLVQAEELHHHWEHLSARIMTKTIQFGTGLSSQISTVLHGIICFLPSTSQESQGKEEKIAVKMVSKSVSAAASALAERRSYL